LLSEYIVITLGFSTDFEISNHVPAGI